MDDATARDIGWKARLLEAEREAARRKPVPICGKCGTGGWVADATNRDGSTFFIPCVRCGNPLGNPNPNPEKRSRYAADDVVTIRQKMAEIEADRVEGKRLAAWAALSAWPDRLDGPTVWTEEQVAEFRRVLGLWEDGNPAAPFLLPIIRPVTEERAARYRRSRAEYDRKVSAAWERSTDEAAI